MKIFTNTPSDDNSNLSTLFVTGLICLLSFTSMAQETENSIHVGLIYPVSSHGIRAREYSNIFSLHALGGISREERGLTISGLTNVVTENTSGIQIAGFSNHIGGYAEGVTLAGFINTYRSGKGCQIAGFANIATKNVTGAQLAGFVNTSEDRHGIQIAGFNNIAKDVKGQQFAGFMNISGNIRGVQASGFMNKAKKVKGVQLAGFINIADSSEYPIAIINIIKQGEKAIGIGTDDNLTTLLTFRSGGKVMYGIMALGHNLKNEDDVYSIQFGIGAHLIDTRYFRLNAEATNTMLENFKKGSFNKYALSLQPSVKVSSRIEVFGGPSFNIVSTDSKDGKELVDNYLWDNNNRYNHLRGIYIGYTAGFHVKF